MGKMCSEGESKKREIQKVAEKVPPRKRGNYSTKN